MWTAWTFVRLTDSYRGRTPLLPMLVPGCAFAETPKQTTHWLAVWSNKCFSGLRFGFCVDTTHSAHCERGVDHGRLKDFVCEVRMQFTRCSTVRSGVDV